MKKSTVNWQQIGVEYQGSRRSVREIAREHGITHSAIYQVAKHRKWTRPKGLPPSAMLPDPVPDPIPPRIQRASTVPASKPDPAFEAEGAEVAQLVKRGRGIILTLMEELEAVNANCDLLTELINLQKADDGNAARRRILHRLQSFPSRVQAAKNLATALATLRDAAPGKKETQQEEAKDASAGWLRDLGWSGGQTDRLS